MREDPNIAHGRADVFEFFKSVDEFRHNAENAPGVFHHFQIRGLRVLFYLLPLIARFAGMTFNILTVISKFL